MDIKIRGKEDTSKAEGGSEEKESHHEIYGEGEAVSASNASEKKECQVEEVTGIILETGGDMSTQTVDDVHLMAADHSTTDKGVEMNGGDMGSSSPSIEVPDNIEPVPQQDGKEESSRLESAQIVEEDIGKSKVEGSSTGITQQDNKEMERNDDMKKRVTVASDELGKREREGERERERVTNVTLLLGGDTKRKALHVCYHCQKKEELAKSFKRCVKCRGKPNPHYYCSRSCQGIAYSYN